MTENGDRWHRWLLSGRTGGDAAVRERLLTESLHPWRTKILDNAALRPWDTLLDVGAGDGLIAFGALDRLSDSGRVIFSDISQDLLDHCREAAAAEGLLDRCHFVRAAADSLTGIGDSSVDVVTTRSVLIYVEDKAAALREFWRVLKPGGRISLFEPINRLMRDCGPGQFYGYDVGPVSAIAAKVRAFYESIQPDDTDPMMDFDDRDLVRQAEDAGFTEIRLDLQVTVRPRRQPCPWQAFLRISGNPLVPAFGEAIDRCCTPAEAAELSDHLRPLVESGTGQERMALACLVAVKKELGSAT
jgi:arsenite methyltransferase